MPKMPRFVKDWKRGRYLVKDESSSDNDSSDSGSDSSSSDSSDSSDSDSSDSQDGSLDTGDNKAETKEKEDVPYW